MGAEPVLRPLCPADLDAAQALSAAFGWPHRRPDWEFMLRLGRGLAAERNGALVGTAMAWNYGKRQAALGMVGVAPATQRTGLGRKLTERLLAELGERSILLYATETGLPLYRALDFAPTGTIRQHQGAAFDTGLMPLPGAERLRPAGRSDPARLAALDRAATGLDRAQVLRAVLRAGRAVVLDRAGEAIGFAILRRFGHGQVIGPVIAPDAARARALIGHFLATRRGEFVRVDVPEESGLGPWLDALGLADAGPAFRMVRGADPAPGGATAQCFALISHAFG